MRHGGFAPALTDEEVITQEFQALHRRKGTQALLACARVAARLVLQSEDQAVSLARLHLGQ